MVRDSLNGASLQTSPIPQDSESPEQSQSSEEVQTETTESSERLNLLLEKLRGEEDPESWNLAVTEADAERLPTHLHPFSSHAECNLVKHTYQQLRHSGFYWGKITMEEAHEILKPVPKGTFLIRDSCQPDVFFTLSYQSVDGPTSVRVQLNNLLFNLYGSHRTFASLFALLTYYTSSPCKLTKPYRKQRPESLKQICRRAFIHTYGAKSISTLPGLTSEVKTYVLDYPYCI